MSVTSNITVTVTHTGDDDNSYSPTALPNTNAPTAISNVALTAGTNTITTPSTTVFQVRAAIIVPPTDNAGTLTLKGASGDTGISISGINPTLLTFSTTAPSSSFLLVASTATNISVIWS